MLTKQNKTKKAKIKRRTKCPREQSPEDPDQESCIRISPKFYEIALWENGYALCWLECRDVLAEWSKGRTTLLKSRFLNCHRWQMYHICKHVWKIFLVQGRKKTKLKLLDILFMKVSIAPSSGPFKNKFLLYGLFVACSFYWCFNFVRLFVCFRLHGWPFGRPWRWRRLSWRGIALVEVRPEFVQQRYTAVSFYLVRWNGWKLSQKAGENFQCRNLYNLYKSYKRLRNGNRINPDSASEWR